MSLDALPIHSRNRRGSGLVPVGPSARSAGEDATAELLR